MSEEIRQELGFSATQALSTLRELDKVMQTFEGRLGASVRAMGGFNKQGGKTVSALKQIDSWAKKASDSVDRLNRNLGRMPSSQTPGGQIGTAGFSEPRRQIDQMLLTGSQAREHFDNWFSSLGAQTKKSQGLWQQWGTRVRGVLGMAQKGSRDFGRSTRQSMDEASRAVNRVTVDWHTMARIVTTQAIVRALSTMRNALKASVSDAIEFERRVAEIRTISTVRNLDRLKDAVHELSDEFNTPLGQVSEGVYQTISNQVADGAGAFQFFGESVKFSKVAVAGADDAVNLLTGTINAFGEGADDAGDIGAKFFRTIQLGRTRAGELAQSFGQVAPIAHQLGVSMEELQAAFATVTISGVNTAKTSTQLKGVLSGLIKPTEDMKRALRELGYENGEQIVAALGLGGSLEALAATTDGTSAELAKLFPRIRGLTAAMILTGEGADKFVENLEKIESASQRLLDEEYQFIFETNAETITREMNKLKNFFVTEFGATIIEQTNQWYGFVGGTDTVIRSMRVMADVIPVVTPLVVGLGAAYLATGAHAKILATNATLASRALGVVGLAVAAYAAGDYIGRSIGEALNEAGEQARQTSRKIVALEERTQREIGQIHTRRLEEVIRLQNQALAEKRKIYLKDVEGYRKAYEQKLSATEGALGRITKAWQNAANEQFQIAAGAHERIRQSQESIADARKEIEDTLFDRQNRQLKTSRQFYDLLARASDIASQAQSALRVADTDEVRQRALADIQRAKALNEQAYAIAEAEQNRGMEYRANKQLLGIQDKLQQAERAYQANVRRSADEAQKKGIVLAETAKELEALQAQIIELLRPVDETGKLLDPQALARNQAEAAKLVKQFLAQAMGQDLPVTRMLDFSGVKEALQKEIQGVDLRVVAASPIALERLRVQIQSAIDRFDLNTTIKAKVEWEEATGQEIQTLGDWDRVSSFAAEELERLNSLITATSAAMTVVEESARGANRALKMIERPAVEPAPLSPYARPEAHMAQAQLMAAYERQTAINELIAKFRELAEAERVTKEELKAVMDQVQALDENTAVSGFWGIHNEEWRAFGDAAAAIYEKIQKLENLDLSGAEGRFQRAREEAEAARQKYEELEQKARQAFEAPLAPAQGTRQATIDAQAAIQGTVAPAQIAGSMASIRADAQAAAAALRSMPANPLAMAAKGGLMPRFRSGGLVPAMHFLASGGRARGIDRIPAMLAPGEFVINQRSSRQFFSQLQAINAGSRPVYRDSGGQVTNIGDVSITIAESSTPKQTAREIMAAIRRESRRGSSRL
jgi:TP901 family phage tail tape measure protein